jgi:hypothetical protein
MSFRISSYSPVTIYTFIFFHPLLSPYIIKMSSITSYSEPTLTELVPALTGESNFTAWLIALKFTLTSRD